MKRTSKELRQNVIQYIKENNEAKVNEIEKSLGVNIHRLFGGIEKAFEEAGIIYTRKIRKFDENKVKEIVDDIKKNPLLTIDDLQRKHKFSFYKHFKSFRQFCDSYNLSHISRHKKRTIKKQFEVIQYIKTHPLATQWEINKSCHTKVQNIFSKGIFEAYEKAFVEYPIFRRKIYGTATKEIRQRAIQFEKTVFKKLELIGRLEKYVNIKGGIIDGILITKNRKFVIEIKNYLSKPICKTEILQLVRYMKTINCPNGILICNNKGNKDKLKIGSYKVLVRTPDEINGAVVQSG